MPKALDPGPNRAERLLLAVSDIQAKGVDAVREALEEHRLEVIGDRRFFHYSVDVEQRGSEFVLSGRVMFPQMKDGIHEILERLNVKADTGGVRVLPEESLHGLRFAIVQVPVARVLKESEGQAETVTTALYGEPVFLLAFERKRYLLQTSVGYLGWVDPDALRFVERDEWDAWWTTRRAVFNRQFSKDGTTIPIGSSLPLEKKKKVRLVNGESLKVSGKDIREWNLKKSRYRDAILEEAERFRGTAYLWGGRSTDGIDCSGFSQMVYRNLGILLARDTTQQMIAGTICATQDWTDHLLVGDLLFFLNPIGRVSHVGISVGGQRFMHAYGAGGVTNNSLNPKDDDYDERFAERFVFAKRMVL